jgi:hypothetical protein
VDATARQRDIEQSLNIADIADLDSPPVPADEQARGIAGWIFAGRDSAAHAEFPGLNWLRQPTTFSDREWILAIAEQFRDMAADVPVGSAQTGSSSARS